MPFPLLLAAAASAAIPTGAKVEPSGFLTVRSAPAAAFTPVPPRDPAVKTPEQIEGDRQFSRVGAFQVQVRDEVRRLEERLRANEAGNFVSLRFDNEGEPSVVFSFLREAEATLRRYTADPRFRAVNVRWTEAQLQSAQERMFAFLSSERIAAMSGRGGLDFVEVKVELTREEYEAAAARRGFTAPEQVVLSFAERNPAELNRPLPPAIARHVRYFARDLAPLGPVPSVQRSATVVLEDGCFRLADDSRALVVFPLGEQLFIDGEGYLAVGENKPGYARIGEAAVFGGVHRDVDHPRITEPLHKACGPGKVVAVNHLKSAAADRAQDIANDHAWLLRSLPESYGLTPAAARAFVRDCAAKWGGRCIMSPPRPAVQPCPEGTSLKHGMCRTAAGHIRPLPRELEPYVKP